MTIEPQVRWLVVDIVKVKVEQEGYIFAELLNDRRLLLLLLLLLIWSAEEMRERLWRTMMLFIFLTNNVVRKERN